MHILTFSPAALQQAFSVLLQGGVVVHATETCYGLACDLSNPAAVAKLFAIKQRPTHQPVSGLFASVQEAKRYVQWNESAEELAMEYLPGPLTLILPMRPDSPKILYPTIDEQAGNHLNKNGTIGVRVSSHPHALAFVTAFNSPLSTTSANVHGKPNPYSAQDIVMQFEGQDLLPDLLLDSGTLPPNPPSKVMDVSTGTILRT